MLLVYPAALRTRRTQVSKISFAMAEASGRETDSVTVSGCGNQSACMVVPCSAVPDGRREQSSLIFSFALASSYVASALAQSSHTPSGRSISRTISLKEIMFFTLKFHTIPFPTRSWLSGKGLRRSSTLPKVVFSP